MAIDELLKIVPPPKHPTEIGTLAQFRQVEKRLGTRLPSDYRKFIFKYGTGAFAREYFVFSPFTANQHLSLTRKVPELCKYERQFKETWGVEAVPYNVYPDSPGILPWGADNNGNNYFWLTTGDPDDWVVVQNEVRGTGYKQRDCSLTEFLLGILSGRIESLVGEYPSDEDHVFEPW